MTDRSLRVFVAFEIPSGIRAGLAAEVGELRRHLPQSRWTRPEGWHLTLKFLGEVEPAVVARLETGLRRQLEGLRAPEARLGGAGFFPTPANPRVAWVGGAVEGVAPVVEAVEAAAEAIGLARERRPWSVHLTIARLKGRWPRGAVEHLLDWGSRLEIAAFACREVVLFESTLAPGGAVYTALGKVPLS